jgi:DNA polymerase III epsilon subunit-like protein
MNTAESNNSPFSFTEDAVTCAYLAIKGITHTSIQINEGGRLGFLFDSGELREAQAEMDSGTARVDPVKFAAILRRILRTYLTKQARRRIKLELQAGGGPDE